jgi:hypothetical protein
MNTNQSYNNDPPPAYTPFVQQPTSISSIKT